MTDLEVQIKDFANVAEDKIEFGLREAMIAEDAMQRGKAHEKLLESLQKVAKGIDRFQEESIKIQGHKGRQASTWSLARDTSSLKLPNLEVSDNMVGCDKERKRILEELRGCSSNELKIIPIVGMGGIGKTTSAQQGLNHQLETLSIKVDRYHVSHWSSRFHKLPVYVPSAIHFPTKLKKLKLVRTRLAWEDLNIIGQWPNLEVLKLKPNACRGLEWRPIEGGFPRLKFLLIEGTNLKCWKATNDHFPALEHLVIRHCFHLEEIPIEFADIYSLQLIELQNCNAKLVVSSGRIQEEQESLGSKALNVRSYNDPAECELSGSDSDSD